MADADLLAFVMWSGVTAVLMVITGIVYRNNQRKKSKENLTS